MARELKTSFPLDGSLTFYRNLLCPMLKKVFGDLDCQSPEVNMLSNFVTGTKRFSEVLHHSPS